MKENNNGRDILVGARLRLQRGRIAEAEHHVIRDNLTNGMPNLQKPRPGFLEDVTIADRTPRDQMVDIGLAYYDALTGEDGTLAPFADECERHENGMVSAGGKPAPKPPSAKPQTPPNPEMEKMMKAMAAMPRTCEGQISTGTFAYITNIKNRRLLVVDEQKGIAVGFSNFYHDSKLKTMKIKNAPGIDSVPAFQGTFNMPAMHFFKIKKGKIYDIEATGISLPYGTKTGWE
jgi:hypothetical protein